MNAHKTAIARKGPSVPLKHAFYLNAITGRVLDFGCGKGADVRELKQRGFSVVGYDPHFCPKRPRGKFDTVLMTYVVNVLKVNIRDRAIREAWGYVKAGGNLIITARTENEIGVAAKKGNWQRTDWGYVTGKGTYQRGYTAVALRRIAGRILTDVQTIQLGGINAGGAMIIVQKG